MEGLVARMRKLLPERRDRTDERRFKIVVLSVVGSVLFMILVALVVFFVTIKGPEQVLVPDVVGVEGRRYDLVSAMAKLQEKGLYARVQLRHSSTLAKGIVMDQRPKAGAVVKAGRRILLTVSSGPVVERLGDYVNKSLSAVRIELEELFRGDEEALIRIREPVSFVHSEAEPGTVIRQSPPPGTPVREGEVLYLDLVVSRGPLGRVVVMGNYLGRPYGEVMSELAGQDIPFIFSARKPSGSEEGGVVVKQTPAPKEQVAEGTEVVLTVTEPRRLERGQEFGVFTAELVRYPILVRMELIARGPTGDRVLASFRHPGGKVGIPYVKEASEQLVFVVNGQEWKR